MGKRAYSIVITQDNDGSVIWLDNTDYNADIAFEYTGGTKLLTSGGVEATVTISDEKKDATRVYKTDSTGLANNEDSYTMTPKDGNFQNDRVLGEIILTKSDLDQLRQNTPRSASSSAVSGTAPHGEASIEGAVYDLYAAADILHPDGVTGVVDYSKIVDSSGKPIWHTTVRTNSGWDESYLPILAKDHLVASAEIKDGKLVFGNLYLGRYYLVERATGIVLPVDNRDFFAWYRLQQAFMQLADTPKLCAAASIINYGTSDDRFTDFRAWLVMQGRAVYLAALADPDRLARMRVSFGEAEWELCGYIAMYAYAGKKYLDLFRPDAPDGQALRRR